MHSLIPVSQASHFFQRWSEAAPGRTHWITSLAAQPLTAARLETELDQLLLAGHALPKALRQLRNLAVCTLIERDLSGKTDLNEVCTVTTALAELVILRAQNHVIHELEMMHGTPLSETSGEPQTMMVIGMGKLGGGELNVSSDIDLIFVYPENGETCAMAGAEPALAIKIISNQEFFIKAGRRLNQLLSEVTEDGFVFRVDMALRPNGNSGALAASFATLENYLVTQGREWERYAWCKARAITGNADDIDTLQAIYMPFVYRRYLDYGSIDALRSMHRQIRTEAIRQESQRPLHDVNVKLGRGGIREIEFLTQVFQLIRGGREPELRDRSTRNMLRLLAAKDIMQDETSELLLASYEFLRNVEHRLQYLDDNQTHTLPSSEDSRQRVAAACGFGSEALFLEALNLVRSQVAACFDDMFSNPADEPAVSAGTQTSLWGHVDILDATIGELSTTLLQLPEAVSLPSGAVAQLATLIQRLANAPRVVNLPQASRTRLIQVLHNALPQIMALQDDATGVAARVFDFFDTIARRSAYLALLQEFPIALTRVISMIAVSSWTATYLSQHPIVLDELIDDRLFGNNSDWDGFRVQCERQLRQHEGDTERQMDILREQHHAQLFRLLAQDLDGSLSVEALADQLSQLADVLVDVTLQTIWRALRAATDDLAPPVPAFAVIAYGKLGGKELGYASDLDLVFLYDDQDADMAAMYMRLAQRFITWMSTMTAAGTLFDIDTALRPDGASGLLVASLGNFEKYQERSAWVWEHQALTRARFCAGDAAIGVRFEAIRLAVLCQSRDPASLRTDVRSMRTKLHAAHPNTSALFDLKHDTGGMIDIEFMVQYLILLHAENHPELAADIGNIALLILAGRLGLIDAELASACADAYRLYRLLQHQLRLRGNNRARTDRRQMLPHITAVTTLWQQLLA